MVEGRGQRVVYNQYGRHYETWIRRAGLRMLKLRCWHSIKIGKIILLLVFGLISLAAELLVVSSTN
jgi:hypothetical protein